MTREGNQYDGCRNIPRYQIHLFLEGRMLTTMVLVTGCLRLVETWSPMGSALDEPVENMTFSLLVWK